MADSSTRISKRQVVFAAPFTLGDSPEVYPAGAYEVEYEETALQGHDRTAYVRTGTTLIIESAGRTVHRRIESEDLEAALSACGCDAAEADRTKEREPSRTVE